VAHCLENPLITSIRVTLSRYNIQTDATYRQLYAESWTYHPNYNSNTIANDIGIVKLSQKVTITPISLSFSSGFPAQGRDVTVIGYGLTSKNGNISDELRQVQFGVRNNNDCNNLYGGVSKTSQICAGGTSGVSLNVSLCYMCHFLRFDPILAILRILVRVIQEAP
jgi:trypsin